MIASTHNNSTFGAAEVDTKPTTPLQEACGRLKAAGLRITQPRTAILSALIRRPLPATIEQIHADLAQFTSSPCDLVTVYRCLAAFEELGLVRRCFFHNGTSLYQLDLDDTPAYHVVDKANDQVHALEADLADELRGALRNIEEKLAQRGFSGVSHMVEFFGRRATAPTASDPNSDVLTAAS